MKKSLIALGLSAVMVAATAVPALADDASLNIYGIYKAGDQTWFIDEGAAAQKAVEAAGGTFTFVDAKMSPEECLKAIDNAIANQADGIVICVPDQTMSQNVVDKCNEYGIAVVAADDALEMGGEKIAPWVGIAGYDIGSSCAEWLCDYMEQNNLVEDETCGVLIMTMSTVSSCVPRTDGEYDVLISRFPEFKDNGNGRLFYADYDGTTEKGNTASAAIITGNPQITKWMVMGANEEGVIGCVRALETNGVDAESACVGMGAYMVVEEYEKGSALRAAPFFSDVAIGTYSVNTLFDVIDGNEVQMETAVPAEITTPENYHDILG